MDSFTRNYSIALSTIAGVLLIWWLVSLWQPRVWELNDLLEADETVANYPYRFRVRRVSGSMAVLSTPRSQDMPVVQFLGIIDPKLAGKAQNQPAMVAAQQDLVRVQKRAKALVLEQEGIERVSWELDLAWLSSRGITVTAAVR